MYVPFIPSLFIISSIDLVDGEHPLDHVNFYYQKQTVRNNLEDEEREYL